MIERKDVAYPQIPDVRQFLTQRAIYNALELEQVFKIAEKLEIPESHQQLFSTYLSGYFAKSDVEIRQKNLKVQIILTNAGVEMMYSQLEIARDVKRVLFLEATNLEIQLKLHPLDRRILDDTAWLIVDFYVNSRSGSEATRNIQQFLSSSLPFTSSR